MPRVQLRGLTGPFAPERPAPVSALAPPATAWLERILKKKVVVHLDTDQSIEGVLMELAEDGLILRAAKLLSNDGAVEDTGLGGETFVPSGRIVFVQLDE